MTAPRLGRRARPGGLAAALCLLVLAVPVASAEDRVTIRGAYFREHSTRVIQPMFQVSKDLPLGFDAGGHFLVDAITSASVAAGTTQDAIFTEMRKEAGLTFGKTFDRTRVGVAGRYSVEPDYASMTGGLAFSQGVWENSGTLAVNMAYGYDDIMCGPMFRDNLKVAFASASYTQMLTPTLVAQLGAEVAYLRGYLGNCYVQVGSMGRERPPRERSREVAVARVAKHLAATGTTFQLHYRFYVDHAYSIDPQPWGLLAHTIEGRIYQEVVEGFDVRLTYRGHSQGAADFWCNTDPVRGGRADCYSLETAPGAPGVPTTPDFFASDAKLGSLDTHVFELKLTWQARPLRAVPILAWFSEGAFELSYGRFLQSTRYGGAHLLQSGYTLGF